MAEEIRRMAFTEDESLEVRTGLKLSYGYEIASYEEKPRSRSSEFQTDLAVVDTSQGGG